MWVEMVNLVLNGQQQNVILFVRMWVEISLADSSTYVVGSSSSWGCELKWPRKTVLVISRCCHPLREDVSWNRVMQWKKICNSVILFVRMWVEIIKRIGRFYAAPSSSSWGCELKYQQDSVEHYCQFVILFVRMWVEIFMQQLPGRVWSVILFVRMWVEMLIMWLVFLQKQCHPLREDVSWNVQAVNPMKQSYCHPLREDVSWNVIGYRWITSNFRHPLREDVSWND